MSLKIDGVSNAIKDTNGNELLKYSVIASAVNEISLANAATGNRPKISATGDDANVTLDLQVKGTGILQLLDGNGNEVIKTGPAVASAVNEVTITNAATGTGPVIAVTGGDANSDLRLGAKGTGKLALTGIFQGDSANSAQVGLARTSVAMSDANRTPAASEYANPILEYTGTLTAGRDIILPNVAGAICVLFNNTTGGFALTVKVSGQTGIAVAATKRAMLYCNGTDYVRMTGDI